MKKSFKLFAAALMVLAMFVPAQANDVLTICEGTNSSSYVPFRNIDFQDDGMHTQLIYPAEMITAMSGQSINSVVFYLRNNGMYAQGGLLVVKMGETDNATYSTARDFREGLTQVAAISLTEGVTELVIDFSTPYMYNGGNLVIDFTNPETGDTNYYGWNSWTGVGTSNFSAIGSDGSMATFLPMATFDYGVPQDWAAKVTPDALTFNVPAEREEVQTITVLNKGLNAFTPAISTLAAPFSIDVEAVELTSGQSLQIPVKFAPTEAGEFNTTLTINCGDAGIFEIPITAVASDPVYEVTVCDGIGTFKYLPFYGLYYDEVGTMGQMIYPEDMLTYLKGNKITEVTFYPSAALQLNGGEVRLSFKVVEQDEFASATAITEMTAVATGSPVAGETELVFTLDEPFEYTGGNLAVEAYVTVSSGYKSTEFYGQSFDYSPSFYHYSSTYKTSNFLPKATFAFEKGAEQEVIRGDVDKSGQVTIGDVTALIDMLLSGAEMITEADCNLDGEMTIGDVTTLIDFLLTGVWAE